MKSAIQFFIVISILLLAFIFSGYFIAPEFKVAHSVEAQATSQNIYPYLSNLNSWELWTNWNNGTDSTVSLQVGKSETDNKPILIVDGEQTSKKEIRITASDPLQGISYTMLIDGIFELSGRIRTTPSSSNPKQTRIEWIAEGDMGYNPLFRYFKRFLEKWIKEDFKNSLEQLQRLSETKQQAIDSTPQAQE